MNLNNIILILDASDDDKEVLTNVTRGCESQPLPAENSIKRR